ncbi:hypothetical protein PZA11_000678 [Diplocarpon coronariae]
MQASRVHVIGNSEGKDNSQDPIQQKKTEEMSGSDESSDEEKEERIMIFRDILATFSDVETEKFRADIFDLRDDVNMEPILVSKDLEATVVRVLMKDDNFFPPFKNLVSHDIRAIAYFKKKGAKARNTLDRLERSCGVGRVAGHDNIVCSAQTLADTDSAISIHVTIRQPLNPAA